MAQLSCCTCKQSTTEETSVVVVRATEKKNPVVRCKKCHNLRSRIERLRNHHGQLVQDWRDLSTEEKDSFITQNAELTGGHLLSKLSEVVTLRRVMRSKVGHSGIGDYLSEHDLQEKYSDQSQIAKNIVKNGRKMWDAVKEIYLYEDVSYTSKTEEEEILEDDRRTHIEQTPHSGSGSGEPVPETPSSGKRGSTGGAPASKKKAKGSGSNKKLQKLVGQLAPVKLELQNYLQKIVNTSLAQLVPVYVVNNAQAVMSKVDGLWDQLQSCLSAADFDADTVEQLERDGKLLIEDATSAVARLKIQVAEADNFVGDSVSRSSSG